MSCLDNDKDAVISNKYYRFQLDDANYGQEIFHDITSGIGSVKNKLKTPLILLLC